MTELLKGKTKIIWRTRPDIDNSIVLYVPLWLRGPAADPGAQSSILHLLSICCGMTDAQSR